MKDKHQNQKAEAFDRMIRSLAAAIKNSALYPPGHPSLVESIKSFSADLDSWLVSETKLELGIAPDNLMANGEYVRKEGTGLYAGVGYYFHERGLLAVIFKRGITQEELVAFFDIIKCDAKVFTQSPGIADRIPKSEHLDVRAIDYGALLKSSKSGSRGRSQTDKDIWQALVSLATGPGGKLPVSKTEFLDGFLRDPEKSAAVLNRVYKEALAQVDHKTTVRKMRDAFNAAAKYSGRNTGSGDKAVHKDIADIIFKLDPDLIARLFDEDREGGGADLSDEIMKALPDDVVADFMASLVGKEGVVNKQLIKFFDHLVTDKTRSSNISTLVGDKLFNAGSVGKDLILRLQGSFKEMLASDPDSKFLNEIYKMTLDTLADSSVSQISRFDEYTHIALEIAEALKDDSLKRQEARLLLNLIWLERSPEQFKKLCDRFIDKSRGLFDALSIQVVREAYELFTEKLDPEVRTAVEFKGMVAAALDVIMAEGALIKIISLIRDSGPTGMNDISRILIMARPKSAGLVVEAYASETDPVIREKISGVITGMGGDALEELVRRLKAYAGLDPEVAAGMLAMISQINPQEAGILSRLMLRSKDHRIMMQALDIFNPQNPGDIATLLDMLDRRPPDDIAGKIIRKVLESRNSGYIELLFKRLGKGNLAKRYLTGAVKLCGDLKVQESRDSLQKILAMKPLFYNKFMDSVRVASVVSMAQLGTAESMAFVNGCLSDKSRAVRRMSSIILELGKMEKAA